MSRRSAESRQVDEGYYAWLKRRKASGKAVPKANKPWHGSDNYLRSMAQGCYWVNENEDD